MYNNSVNVTIKRFMLFEAGTILNLNYSSQLKEWLIDPDKPPLGSSTGGKALEDKGPACMADECTMP